MKKLNYIWMHCVCGALAFVAMLFFVGGLTACSHDDEPNKADLKGDVAVYVNLLATRSGDPGSAHEEDQMQWDNLRIYLLYDNNRVAEHTLNRTQYNEMGKEGIKLRVPVGTAQVYAVAYTGKISLDACATAEQVRNLTTGDMTVPGITKTDWINLFSGKSVGKIEVKPDEVGRTAVALTRLVAKIDVQYDVQEGLDGVYESITMDGIDFYGPTTGYFFPEDAGKAFEVSDVPVKTSVCNDPVSQRNGRQYFYTFPTTTNGKHQFGFTLTYTPKSGAANAINGNKEYRFSFKEPLKATQWYKVNLTVKGNNIDATDLELTSKP